MLTLVSDLKPDKRPEAQRVCGACSHTYISEGVSEKRPLMVSTKGWLGQWTPAQNDVLNMSRDRWRVHLIPGVA